MKRFLSTVVLTLIVFFGRSQVILNEIYTNPGDGKHEFFELYNTSSKDVDLDCYTLVTLFQQNNRIGLYVLDLPKLTIKAKSYFVGAAAKTFNVQQKTNYPADFSWNNFNDLPVAALGTGSLKSYALNASKTNYELTTFSATPGIYNLFPELANSIASGVVYGVFLFNNEIYINGLLTGYNKSTVPSEITSLPSIKPACTTQQIIWQNVTTAENVNEAGGSDNGYARIRDGICGTWNKTANGISHTPGAINGNSSTTSTSQLSTNQDALCGSNIHFSISSALSSPFVFPVDVYLYEDNVVTGVLDVNDKYIAPTKTITYGDNATYYFTPITNRSYLLVYETALGCIDKIASIDKCVVLPVHFQSFNATRNKDKKEQVVLKWVTATEQNNRGFNVQKKVNGQWKNIAFVFSQAENGNSNTALSYEYKDANVSNTVTQYQIQQVDYDGKTSYSDIRSVVGMEQKKSVVTYPNPGVDGKVNLLFSEVGSVKQVIVSDMNGRIVKEYRQVTDNNLTIDGLKSGFYTIKITDRATATTTVEKVIIR